jgi:hypothetical protein
MQEQLPKGARFAKKIIINSGCYDFLQATT